MIYLKEEINSNDTNLLFDYGWSQNFAYNRQSSTQFLVCDHLMMKPP